ncbi:MAG TPA: PDR/VanB family oxidoreductase [Ramlibacter sp.]|uniref:PDR/VanB family oxidoreductase n=1 Tax=Ramlibacter sp. TaxID=1917967 RepID=UPI002B82C98A|nr:PDR/VanB family oxidoreductase [Ramlibacter sp.]HVZ46897.1 PDR/VanB family oxidoreductase [Ramlibacter sp.]
MTMIQVRVRSIAWEAEGILSFELVDPQGGRLPAFEAGAHIDVRMPGGVSRRYSLCNVPGETRFWRIAVLRTPESRGGSRTMHEKLRPGDLIEVSEPHNFFALDETAERTVLVAGGIGITPLLAMVHRLQQLGRRFELHYCTRNAARTAFASELAPLLADGVVRIHHDNGDPKQGLDLAALLREPRRGTHVYYCGPAGFMNAAKAATAHWTAGTVHFEYFGAEPLAAPETSGESTMEVRLAKSGRTIPIEPAQTLLQALRAAGVDCESSCEAGVCGTCLTPYSAGDIEHNDLILNDDERRTEVLVCCARVRQGPVVLDI